MMMKSTSNNHYTDITLSLLLVAFVVLKLCKVIDWSWWWVLSPIWIPLGVVGIIAVSVVIYSAVSEQLKNGKRGS